MNSQAKTPPSYEQGEKGSFSLLMSVTMGFCLLWLCFFLALMHLPFVIPLDAVRETWSLSLLPIAIFLGLIACNLTFYVLCDFFTSKRGHQIARIIIVVAPLGAGAITLLQLTVGSDIFVPAFLLIGAWGLLGFGLSCLLQLWTEFLAIFIKAFASKVLCSSVGVGGVLFFIISIMPSEVGVAAVCIAGPISVGILYFLGKENQPLPAVSRKESASRHRLSASIDTINTFYCIGFGLAMQMLSPIESSISLSLGLFITILAGSAFMLPFLTKNTSKMMHGKVQKILFPFIVLGLLPIPFVSGPLQVGCMLILVACFICLLITCLDSLLCLVKRYQLAPLYLTGRGISPLLVGTTIGYGIGVFAAESHLSNDIPLLIALGMVVILALMVTFIQFDKDYLAEEDALREKQDNPEAPQKKGSGHFKIRCETIAKDSGLSSRETEVFYLLAKGHGNAYIQEKLFISPHTVRAHVYNIYKKMEISSREELLQAIEESPQIQE